jgi:hypothetical protein
MLFLFKFIVLDTEVVLYMSNILFNHPVALIYFRDFMAPLSILTGFELDSWIY